MLTPSQENQLTSGGDCVLHFHASDHIVTHDTLSRVQQIATQVNVSTTSYSVASNDDYVLVSVTSTITLPRAINGQEYEIVKLFAGGSVTILPSGTDTIQGTTSVIVYAQWTALRFKAISGGWIII